MTMTPDERAVAVVERMLSSATRTPEDVAEWIAAAIREAVEEAKAVCVMIAHNEGDAFGAVPEASNACRSVAAQIERHYDVFAHAYRKISTSSPQSATRSESVE